MVVSTLCVTPLQEEQDAKEGDSSASTKGKQSTTTTPATTANNKDKLKNPPANKRFTCKWCEHFVLCHQWSVCQ